MLVLDNSTERDESARRRCLNLIIFSVPVDTSNTKDIDGDGCHMTHGNSDNIKSMIL